MLGGLLKPNWQSDSAEKRRLAVLKMPVNDQANQSIFATLALEDPDHTVRAACISQLKSASQLFSVYQNQTDKVLKSQAKHAFCDLIGSNSALSEIELNALLAEFKDAHILIAQLCPYSNLRSKIFDNLDQIECAQAIDGVAYADTRLYLAERLTEIEALEIARRKLKGKDKKSEKTIRAKLEEYRSKNRQQKQVDDEAAEICEKIEFIANHPEWRSEFKDRYRQYLQRWSALRLKPHLSLIHI